MCKWTESGNAGQVDGWPVLEFLVVGTIVAIGRFDFDEFSAKTFCVCRTTACRTR